VRLHRVRGGIQVPVLRVGDWIGEGHCGGLSEEREGELGKLSSIMLVDPHCLCRSGRLGKRTKLCSYFFPFFVEVLDLISQLVRGEVRM
jgi:hypothetical protein